MSEEIQSETRASGLPVPVGTTSPRPSLARSGATAAFVSQLIAAHERMAPQRPRRQGTPEGATGAYARGARMAERRMPAGYRTKIDA